MTPALVDRFGWLRDRPARPLAIAHRGASDWAPDNSLASFRRAALLGADLWEVDVRTARDGTLVAAHDPQVRSVDGRRRAVASLPGAELAASTGGATPRFDEVLALAAAAGCGVYVDAKDEVAAARAPERLRAHGIERAVIAAFSSAWLGALGARGLGYPLAVLVGRGADPLEAARRSGADIVHLSHAWAAATRPPWRADAALLDRLRARGLLAVLWHEEDPARVAAMLGLPVLGVCSNRPELLRRYAPAPSAGRPAIVCRGGAPWLAPRATLAGAHAALGAGYGLVVEARARADAFRGGERPPTLDEALGIARAHDGELRVELAGADARAALERVEAAGLLGRCTFGAAGAEGPRTLGALPGGVRTIVRRRDVASLAEALATGATLVELEPGTGGRDEAGACRAAGRAVAAACPDPAALRAALDVGAELVTLDRPHALRRLLEPGWPDGEASVPAHAPTPA